MVDVVRVDTNGDIPVPLILLFDGCNDQLFFTRFFTVKFFDPWTGWLSRLRSADSGIVIAAAAVMASSSTGRACLLSAVLVTTVPTMVGTLVFEGILHQGPHRSQAGF